MEPAEIKALANLLEELDYYQLLESEPSCTASELKRAYHTLSRRVHPDANRRRAEDVRDAAERITKRVTEAYSVLRAPRRRRAYDEHLRETGERRMQLAEAEARADQKSTEEHTGTTPNGRRFFTLAHGDLDRGDHESAARNLKMALTYEPGNAFFKEQLERIKKQCSTR